MRAERTNPGQAPKPIATPLRSRWGAALISAVAVTASLIFVAWAKMETVQITYEIDDLIDTEQELAEEQRRLRSQLAELRSPQALHQLAPELGLAAPEGLAAVLDDSAEADVDPIAPEEGPTP